MFMLEAADVYTSEVNKLIHLTPQGRMGSNSMGYPVCIVYALLCGHVIHCNIESGPSPRCHKIGSNTYMYTPRARAALPTISHSGPVECGVMSSLVPVEEYLNQHSVGNNNKPDNAWTALIRQVSPIALPVLAILTFLFSSDLSKIYGIN